MRNMGIVICIVGLILFFFVGLPDWIVKLIALGVTVLGVYTIVNPDKANELYDKYTKKD